VPNPSHTSNPSVIGILMSTVRGWQRLFSTIVGGSRLDGYCLGPTFYDLQGIGIAALIKSSSHEQHLICVFTNRIVGLCSTVTLERHMQA